MRKIDIECEEIYHNTFFYSFFMISILNKFTLDCIYDWNIFQDNFFNL